MRIKYIEEKTGTITITEARDVSYNILKNRFYVVTEAGSRLTFFINSRNFEDMVQTLVKFGWIDMTAEQLMSVNIMR